MWTMYKRILVELKGDRSDGDVLPLLQELLESHDVERVLLVRRIAHGPVSVGDFPLNVEDVLRADQEKEMEALRYLWTVQEGIHWYGVDSSTRVEYTGSGLTMEELAEREGCDMVLLPASQTKGLLRWFWRRVTGRVERAGAVPLVIYGRPARHPKAA